MAYLLSLVIHIFIILFGLFFINNEKISIITKDLYNFYFIKEKQDFNQNLDKKNCIETEKMKIEVDTILEEALDIQSEDNLFEVDIEGDSEDNDKVLQITNNDSSEKTQNMMDTIIDNDDNFELSEKDFKENFCKKIKKLFFIPEKYRDQNIDISISIDFDHNGFIKGMKINNLKDLNIDILDILLEILNSDIIKEIQYKECSNRSINVEISID